MSNQTTIEKSDRKHDLFFGWPSSGLRAIANKQSKASGSVDLYLDDVIGSQFGGVSPRDFNDQLSKAGSVKEVRLFINSPGGSVFDGLSIYNTLRRHPANVIVEVTGLSASAASVVMLAGDERRMAESAFVMIHDAWDMTVGNSETHRVKSERLEMYSAKIADIYAQHTSLSADEAKEMMSRDGGDGTWLDSSDAYDWGFVHSVTDGQKMAAHAKSYLTEHGLPNGRNCYGGSSIKSRTNKIDERLEAMAKLSTPFIEH